MASALPPATDISPGTENDRSFFGHPRGLRTLFFTEMWERFSFYGMRALLSLFMGAEVLLDGGMGLTAANAGIIYGIYTASVYLMSLPGGWLADKFWGQRKAVMVGGVLIMFGHLALSLPVFPGMESFLHSLPANTSFYLGLGLVVFGTGLLKPNISSMVGMLYAKHDIRRDGGYAIYYMGINIGGFAAPLLCGYLAQSNAFRNRLISWGVDYRHSWHFGFIIAAIGMAAGLVYFAKTTKHLGKAGDVPLRSSDPVIARRELKTLWLVLTGVFSVPVLFVALIATDVLSTKAQVANVFGVGLSLAAVILFVYMWKNVANEGERKRLIAMIVLFLGCIVFFGVFEQAGGMLSLFTEKHAKPTILGIEFETAWYQSKFRVRRFARTCVCCPLDMVGQVESGAHGRY
jgi:proton-dependent oligopeptide transporter, POT family